MEEQTSDWLTADSGENCIHGHFFFTLTNMLTIYTAAKFSYSLTSSRNVMILVTLNMYCQTTGQHPPHSEGDSTCLYSVSRMNSYSKALCAAESSIGDVYRREMERHIHKNKLVHEYTRRLPQLQTHTLLTLLALHSPCSLN